ncbi:MAG: TonB-dependent receptor [Parabacteroides sp.]|nr:TonB-dependent receptor [Parabacteroides sp.]
MIKNLKVFLLSTFLLVIGAFTSIVIGQQAVSGIVIDTSYGETLPGATVILKGTSTGTITNEEGRFTIPLETPNGVLQVSYIGYQTKEVDVSAGDVIEIKLDENVTAIDEVVITAFATQKKVNVTGAISSLSGDALVATPVSNIANALIGNTPGVSGLQSSGEPGRNAANIIIRGVSTYGSSAPLIVIDGIEQAAEQAFTELNAMDANEISEISVLKDAASTAVYGIRAANGVIIVTTKKGRSGTPRINFSSNYGLTGASNLQKGVTAYEYALLRNEGIRNEQRGYAGMEGLSTYIFDDYDLWKFKNNRDFTPVEVDAMSNLSVEQKEQLKNAPALYYASNDLYRDQFSKMAPQFQTNLNISGGTQRVNYFVSLGFYNQEGITNAKKYYGSNTGSQFNRYNFRGNFGIQVADNWDVDISLSGQFGQTEGPGINSGPYDLDGRYKVIMQYIYDGNPFITPGIVDGKLINNFAGVPGTVQNPLGAKTGSQIGSQNAVYNLLISGRGTIYNNLLSSSIRVNHNMDYLLKGLKAHATVSYQDNYNRYATYSPSIPSYSVQRSAENPNELQFFGGSMGAGSFNSYGYSNWNKLYFDAGLNWSGSFEDHNLTALLLGKGSKYTMPSDSYNVPSGIVGLVGRVTYNYMDRYMAEFNAGYNGTEQFDEGKRFGLFPAFSFGWVPTAEEFFPKNDIVTFIKLRASYGEVGNDQLGGNRRYYYLPNTYNLGQGGYWFGNSNGSSQNSYYQGATEGALGNPNITWERARKYDVGLEVNFLNDRLHFMTDWFKEDRNNILTTLGTIPAVYGVPSNSVPPANVGITENKGFEVVLKWEDHINALSYSIEGNMSYARNKIIYKAEAENPYPWMNATGFSIGQRFGLRSDGLFNTQEELNNRPYNTYTSNRATLGDVRYVDLNGDGLIDSKDVAPIGYPNYAEIQYNTKLRLVYKGFDMNVLFTGAANGSYYLNSGYTIPFFKRAGNAWQWMYDNRWTQEKYLAGEKITYPRSTFDATPDHNNYLQSDFWMRSSNFLKLKNIEFGYTMQPDTFKFLKMVQGLRIYVNANNLFTFRNELTDIGIDPEITDGRSYIYPLTKVVTVGLSFQF